MKKLLTLTACLGLMSAQYAFAQMISEKIIQSVQDISKDESSLIFHLPSSTTAAVSPTSHLPPLTLIQPVSRIVTTEAEGQEAIQYEMLMNRAHVAETQSQAAKPYSSEHYAWGNVASSYDKAAKAFQKATSATASENRLLSKLASADEVQGVDGAQKLSVQKLLDASGADISLPSLRDAVETDEARRTKDFGAGLYASYCPSQNPSSTQHSSSLPQVAVDGNETIRTNTGATKQFAAGVEFRKRSNEFLATLWSKTAKQYQESAEYHTQAAKNISNTNKTGYDHFSKAGHAASWSAHLLEEAFTAWEKSNQTKESHQEEFAALWLKIGELNQESAEHNIQAARAISSGNETDYNRFERAGFALQESALRFQVASMVLEKAIQAREVNQEELAASLLKAVEQYQESAKYYNQAAGASVNGNKTDFDRFEGAAAAMERDAKRLEEASTILNLETQAAEINQEELASMCYKTVEQYQQLSEYCSLSTSAFASRNDDNYDRFNKEKDIIWRSAGRLEEAFSALQKAACATAENQKELATLWIKTTDYYRQAVNRLLSEPTYADEEQEVGSEVMDGNDVLYNRFLQMARSSAACADQLELLITAQKKAAQATEANQEGFVALWLKNAKQHEEAAEYYRQAVVIGNSVDYKWDDALDVSVKNSAERLEKAASAQEQAIQAKAANQEEGAALWLATVQQWQESSVYARQAANAAINKNRLLSKLAYADEVQGADGAQKLSVQKLLDASSTGATKQFAAEVEYQVVGRPRDRLRRAELEQPEGRAERERASQFGKQSNETDYNHFYNQGISARDKARALESQAEKLTNKKKGFLF